MTCGSRCGQGSALKVAANTVKEAPMFDGTMTPAKLAVIVAAGVLMWVGLVALGMWIVR